ncbi:hypothetical protein [Phaeobacter inhibens]|uniref:Uncharacterized protein n=1 Tax=Phaeobacter inhibens TaxID=221822 RepID=A0A2I7KFF5_9RHOB|nr:hypothetical protein [Phaeobacter inhibens]AUR01316.1 hypothetical protein PhaeoP88_04004 [Phaeobacter inhibens]
MNESFICIGFQLACEQFPTRLIPLFRIATDDRSRDSTVYFQFSDNRGRIEAFVPTTGSSVTRKIALHPQFGLGNQSFKVGDEFLCGFAISDGELIYDTGLEGFVQLAEQICRDPRTMLAPMLGVRLSEILDNSEFVRKYIFEAIRRTSLVMGQVNPITDIIFGKFPHLKQEIIQEEARLNREADKTRIVLLSSMNRIDFFRRAHHIICAPGFEKIEKSAVLFELNPTLINEGWGQRLSVICSRPSEVNSVELPVSAQLFLPSDFSEAAIKLKTGVKEVEGREFFIYQRLEEIPGHIYRGELLT